MSKHKPNGQAPLRVFIGTSAGGEDAEACAVVEASLRHRASIPIEVEWLKLSRASASPCAGWRTERWSTPWTALRWAVPAICGWRGRAVYFDCPTLVLGGVAELGDAPVPSGAFVLARREGSTLLTGCLVFDCAEAKKHLPALAKMKEDVGAHQEVGALLNNWQPTLAGALPGDWGRTDADFARKPPVDLGGSVHFVSPHTQPHGPRADARLAKSGRAHWFAGTRLPHYCARLIALWGEEVARAAQDEFTVERYVPDEPYGAYAIGGADRVEAGRRA